MNIVLLIFEIIGTVAFSVSGVLSALHRKMDLLGVVFMGLITSVGGGVLRDLLLGQMPPRAFLDPTYAIIAIITSLLVFIVFKIKWLKSDAVSHAKLLLIMDSIGLAVFTIVGIEVSQNVYGFNLLLNLFMGVVTAVGGGVMRDACSCQIPYIFTKHFYASASIIGAVLYIVLNLFTEPLIAGLLGIFSIFLLRILASKFMWNLPKAD